MCYQTTTLIPYAWHAIIGEWTERDMNSHERGLLDWSSFLHKTASYEFSNLKVTDREQGYTNRAYDWPVWAWTSHVSSTARLQPQYTSLHVLGSEEQATYATAMQNLFDELSVNWASLRITDDREMRFWTLLIWILLSMQTWAIRKEVVMQVGKSLPALIKVMTQLFMCSSSPIIFV